MNENAPTNPETRVETTANEESFSSKLAKLQEELDEANATLDGGRAGKIELEIAALEKARDEKYLVSNQEEVQVASPEEVLLAPEGDIENFSTISSRIDEVVNEWKDKQPSLKDNLKPISDLAQEAYNLYQVWKDNSPEGATKKEELLTKIKEIREVRDKIYNYQVKFANY